MRIQQSQLQLLYEMDVLRVVPVPLFINIITGCCCRTIIIINIVLITKPQSSSFYHSQQTVLLVPLLTIIQGEAVL
jgi:hypothetical protein